MYCVFLYVVSGRATVPLNAEPSLQLRDSNSEETGCTADGGASRAGQIATETGKRAIPKSPFPQHHRETQEDRPTADKEPSGNNPLHLRKGGFYSVCLQASGSCG